MVRLAHDVGGSATARVLLYNQPLRLEPAALGVGTMRGLSKDVVTFMSAATVWMMMSHSHGVDGHAFQTKSASRQFLHTNKFNDG